jgi:hypothetical protein
MFLNVLPWIIVGTFGTIFGYAAFHEIRRRRIHGPPDNARDAFEFDEDAPSYEEPPEPEEAPDDETTESEGAGTPPDEEMAEETPDPDEEDKR